MVISRGEKICLYEIYRYIELLVKRLVKRSEAEEVLKNIEYYEKISQTSLHRGTVDHNFGKR